MLELQDLGIRLTQLSEKQLDKVPIESKKLFEAVLFIRKITTKSALRRQRQYIGKLMRDIDPQPIQEALIQIDRQHQRDKVRHHRLEQLRDTLLQQGDKGIKAITTAYPSANRQQLRQLIRQHQLEVSNNKAQSGARKLFHYLRSLDESPSL